MSTLWIAWLWLIEEPVSGDEDSSQPGGIIEDVDTLEPLDAASRELMGEQVQHALSVLRSVGAMCWNSAST
jgi:DNA-directed RNA polymerase sigma subunit (sigma70/sigma32)